MAAFKTIKTDAVSIYNYTKYSEIFTTTYNAQLLTTTNVQPNKIPERFYEKWRFLHFKLNKKFLEPTFFNVYLRHGQPPIFEERFFNRIFRTKQLGVKFNRLNILDEIDSFVVFSRI